jgi:GH35 family endo-1,4-beta-xylanase/predicted esterase
MQSVRLSILLSLIAATLQLGSFATAQDKNADEPEQNIPGSTLPELADGFFEIGVGTSVRAIQKNEKALRLFKEQFSIATPENCMKPAAVQNEEGVFNFGGADQFVELAKKHKKSIVGHCLVWAKDDRTPPWFYQDGDKLASKELLDERMKAHIDKVVERYGKDIHQWDVVNEVLSDGGDGEPYRESKWMKIYGGPEFVVNAFKYARAAAPNATLVYNDYRATRPGKREKLMTLLKYLKDNGAPVDAVGLQGHYELDDVPYEFLQETFDEIRKLGLKVIVSEVDIDVVKRGNWYAPDADRETIAKHNPYADGLPKEIQTKLAQQYFKLFQLYLKNADIVERVTFWNLSDDDTWLNTFPWDRVNHPLLFDRNGDAKEAFNTVREAFHAARENELRQVDSKLSSSIPTGTVFPLWSEGAPGFEDRKDEPEEAKDWWVKNIHNPSLTVFLPPSEKATGAAVVVCPGGGHRQLVFDAEGTEAAEYLNELGVAVFALKYRLGREENSPYKIDVHAKQDGQRAMRWVRTNAKAMNIDPNRIGIFGFSAGGEVVSMVAYDSHDGDDGSADFIERVSCKPDFQIMIYPGPLGIPETIPEGSAPAFLLVANDDGASKIVIELAQKLRAAKVPTEMHLYTQGGHGFNMGNRTQLKSISGWRNRLGDWLSDSGYLSGAEK